MVQTPCMDFGILVMRMGFEPSRTRTCDPLVKSQLLYRLSYRPIYMQKARKSGILHEKYLATKRHIKAQNKIKKILCSLCVFVANPGASYRARNCAR